MPSGGVRPVIPAWIGVLALGGLAAAIILLAVVILRVRTPDGTLVVEVSEPDAQVRVSDEHRGVVITRSHATGPLTIAVDPGHQRLQVEKEGFRFFTKDFSVEAGGKAIIMAKLIPLGEEPTLAGPKHPAARAESPASSRWLEEVAALPAAGQVGAVAARLKELNIKFDGKLRHKIEGGVVTCLGFPTDEVTDISPVGALTGLRSLDFSVTLGKGRLSDLTPLAGMPLSELNCSGTAVSDLSPLKGMRLTALYCTGTAVSDLSPLAGMRLAALYCARTRVSDLSPLRGMRLTGLDCSGTAVTDLSPLEEMPLKALGWDLRPERDARPLHRDARNDQRPTCGRVLEGSGRDGSKEESVSSSVPGGTPHPHSAGDVRPGPRGELPRWASGRLGRRHPAQRPTFFLARWPLDPQG